MTENTTPALEPVTPPGVDPLDDLTVGELGTIGKLIKYDPAAAVQDPTTGLRWPALAHIAWAWARRTDPTAKLAPFLELTAEQVGRLLRLDEPTADTGDGDAETNPTDSTPA